MRAIFFATSALAALAIATAASAQATDVSELVVNNKLEEALPQQLQTSGVRVDIITQEQIAVGGYIDVTETLAALTPGLTIVSKSGPFDYVDLSFQGSRTQDVLWLVDGVRINNRLYASTTPLDTVPVAMVDHIEVLEGGQALFYGTQGVAGAIDIVTRPFTDTAKGDVSLTGLDLDGIGGVHGEGHFSDRIGDSQFVVFVSGDQSKGGPAYLNYQPSATDRNRGYTVLSGGLKYAWSPSAATRLSFSYLHTDANLDYAQPYEANDIRNHRQEDLATVKLDEDFSDAVSLYLKGYYHRWHTLFTDVTNDLDKDGGLAGTTSTDVEPWGYDDIGANALARFRLNKGFEYYLGYDLQSYRGSDSELIIKPSHGVTNAVFGQVRTTHDLFADGDLAAGLRYSAASSGQNSLIWNLTGQYDFSQALFVRGTLGTNFRLPTAEELFANDPNDELGNPNLKPEKSQSLNLSVGGTAGPVSWELIGFARNISNLIDLDTFDEETNQDVFGNLADKVQVRGGEIDLEARLCPGLTGLASYTHSDAEMKGSSQQINRIPKDQAKASLDWTPAGSPYGALVTVTWTGDEYTTLNGGPPLNYGDFFLANAGAHYDFGASHSWRLNVSVDNIFNKHYGRPTSAPLDDGSGNFEALPVGEARTFRAGVTKSF